MSDLVGKGKEWLHRRWGDIFKTIEHQDLSERILFQLADRITRESERAGGNYSKAYTLWLRVTTDGDALAVVTEYFAGQASEHLDAELTRRGVGESNVRYIGSDHERAFHFDPRPVSVEQIDMFVADEQARNDLRNHGFGIEAMRTRFTLVTRLDGVDAQGFQVYVGGAPLKPLVSTRCVLEGDPSQKCEITVQKQGGLIGRATVSLPLPADVEGGVVTIDVHSPAPEAGEVTILGLPSDMTLSIDGRSASCFEPIKGLGIGEPFTIRATKDGGDLVPVEYTHTLADARRTFIALGMRPAKDLTGAMAIFTSREPSLRRLHLRPGVTLIRRAISRDDRAADNLPPDEIVKALKSDVNLTMHLDGMDQILVPKHVLQVLPRSVWFWVVNMPGAGTLVDLAEPDPQSGLQVLVAAKMLSDQPGPVELALVSGGKRIPITPTAKYQYCVLKPGVPLQVQAKDGELTVDIFTLLRPALPVVAAAASVRGVDARGGTRDFLLDPGGASMRLDPDLEACGTNAAAGTDDQFDCAMLTQGNGGHVHLYPSGRTRAHDDRKQDDGTYTLRSGDRFSEGTTTFEIL